MPEKKERKKQATITDMNRVSEDQDTTCEITDLNCVEGQESETEELSINKMNPDTEDKSCDITNLNCEDDA